MEKALTLCSALYDPKATLVLPLRKAAKTIKEVYSDWVIAVTIDTDQNIIQELKQQGFIVVTSNNNLSTDPIENNHLLALQGGIAQLGEDDLLQYTDGDRIIFGAAYFPDNLKETAEKIKANDNIDYISLVRSIEDNNSHHDALVLTEASFTRAYRLAAGDKVDPGSTGHVFSKRAGEFILSNSKAHDIMQYPHGKWVLMMKEAGFNISSLETTGILSFETPLQFNEILAADAFIEGSFMPDLAVKLRDAQKNNDLPPLEALREYYYYSVQTEGQDSPVEWKKRIALAKEWIDFLIKEMNNIGLSKIEQSKLLHVIEIEKEKLSEIKRTKTENNFDITEANDIYPSRFAPK